MRRTKKRWSRKIDSVLVILTFLGLSFGLKAEAESGVDDQKKKVTYEDDVLPIFRNRCSTCHNPNKARADLNLMNYDAALAGSSSGEVLFAGDLDSSMLYLAITHQEEPNMPPKNPKIPEAEIATIKRWIEGGLLQSSGGKVPVSKKPTVRIVLDSASIGRPEGPIAMPKGLPLDPIGGRTARANAVTSISTSPWAPVLAIAGTKQVFLFHSETLDPLGTLGFPDGFPYVTKFSRNGNLLLVGGGRGGKSGHVVIYDIQSGRAVLDIGEEYDSVLAADISSDHSQIAMSGPGKLINIYSTSDGKLLHSIKKHTDWLLAMEYSPDGVLLATGDRSSGLHVWESYTGQEFFTLKGHRGPITDLSWRNDSNVLATASEDGTIRLWNMENGSEIRNWRAHSPGVASIEFTHDGRIVSCGRDKTTKTWDQNGKLLRTFEAFTDLALRATFNHDGNRVIAGDWTGEIRVWDSGDGKRLGTLSTNPPTLSDRIETTSNEVSRFETDLAKLDESAKSAQETLEKARAALDTARKAISSSQSDYRVALERAIKALQALADSKTNFEKTHKGTKSTVAEVVGLLDHIKKSLDKATDSEDQTLPKALKEAETQAKQVALTLANLRQSHEQASQEFAKARSDSTAANGEVAKIKSALDTATKGLPSLEEAIKRTSQAYAKAKAAAEETKKTLTAAQAKFQLYERVRARP